MDEKTQKSLEKTLKFHASGLRIPEGAAKDFIDCTIKNVNKALKSKTLITKKDLDRIVYKGLKKYSADLAYVYINYDKII